VACKEALLNKDAVECFLYPLSLYQDYRYTKIKTRNFIDTPESFPFFDAMIERNE
jgi:hypothetical protein